MTDFLLELLSEEIPARMQAKASADLARLLTEQLAAAGLAAEAVETCATPRRLALIARGLPAETAAVREETKGPRTSAPPQALEGFLRKTGLTADQLVERDGIWFAILDKPGRATVAVLAEAIPAIIRGFPWPKSMRWGDASASPESLRWVRPLQGIVALFGEEIVPVEIAGVRFGASTVGHRFHHPGIITIGSANDYLEKLHACRVIADPAERRRLIAEGARAAAAAAGLTLVEDEGLLAENAGLTEWPMPLLGRFDPAFLQVPPEVIRLTMRTNQKYFACVDGEGSLSPHFICTANIEAADGGARIVAGNEKVLAARLADAKFFWEQDLRIPLEDQAQKLGQIVFHEKLGTVADKVDRVAKLARWLVEQGIIKPSPLQGRGLGEGEPVPIPTSVENPPTQPLSPALSPEGERESLAALAEHAARLCKADLVTGMVGEFPELQGLIGGYLARAQGEDPQVADAIRDHYKPVGQGDEVPTAPVTVAVSLADKLDTLAGFFVIDERPTGSKDPFALRRAALGLIAISLKNELRFSTYELFRRAVTMSNREYDMGEVVAADYFNDFLVDRLKVQQRDSGVRHDIIDAVVLMGGDDDVGGERDLVRLLARVHALQSFVETSEGKDLLAGYKRAANILKKEGHTVFNLPPMKESGRTSEAEQAADTPREPRQQPLTLPQGLARTPDTADAPAPAGTETPKTLSYTPLDEEAQLIAALDSAAPRAAEAVEAEDFEGAMAALASLRGPVDAFFDKVTVNDPDPAKREARLDLLARMRDAVHTVADFSRIEG
jgi:glycyl-tRNA synthetase beta chain